MGKIVFFVDIKFHI